MMKRTKLVSFFVVMLFSQLVYGESSKVLFIGKQPDHPFGSHMYLQTCRVLAKCLANHGVETIISDGWPQDAETLAEVDAIVVYTSPAAEFLLDGPHRNEVIATMKRGVGIATIHWASSIFQKNLERLGPNWFEILGGTWVSNVGLYTGSSPLQQLVPNHPICRGWESHDIHDEYYLNPTIKTATPLLQVVAKEQPVVVAWVYERPDGGRAFATTLGHFYRNFQQEPFRRMIVNGILWSAKVDIPTSGANVVLTDAELALPANPEK